MEIKAGKFLVGQVGNGWNVTVYFSCPCGQRNRTSTIVWSESEPRRVSLDCKRCGTKHEVEPGR
jgi:transcription elongation factor Elf1